MVNALSHLEQLAEPPTASRRCRLLLYLTPLVVGPLLILVVAFAVVPTEWFIRRAGTPWLIGVGYGDSLWKADCQVVIYGDSTAEVGINPEVIRRKTGLSTCNIGQLQGLRLLSGDIVLDDYLRQNAPPRFLVFLYSSQSLNLKSGRIGHPLFEALTWQMGRKHRLRTLASLYKTPEDAFRWAYMGVHMAVKNSGNSPMSMERLHTRERTGGQLLLEDLPMSPGCSDVSRNLPPDREYVNGLRTAYGNANTHVIVDLMPLPDCDPGFATLEKQFDGLIDNGVTQLPASVYFYGGLHVNAKGADLLSERVSQQILQKMSSQPMAASDHVEKAVP